MSQRSNADLKSLLAKNQDIVRARLQDALEERGWKIPVLSERSGVKEPTIRNFKSGGSNLGYPSFQSLAKALGVSEEFLLGLTLESTREADTNNFPNQEKQSLELSDKIARLTPAHRAIVESVVDLMLVQNTSTPKKRK